MHVYAESSAVLAWLLGDRGGEEVAEVLAEADGVVASDLTRIECERVLVRAWSTKLLTEVAAADHRAVLAGVVRHWVTLRIDERVRDRSLRPYPLEPVRTLDAIHLASALVAREAVPDLVVLSLDGRIRQNAERLGFEVRPAD